MATRKKLPRRRSAWVERMLADRRPPVNFHDWQQFRLWRAGELAVPGLPDSESDEGRQLLRTFGPSLR